MSVFIGFLKAIIHIFPFSNFLDNLIIIRNKIKMNKYAFSAYWVAEDKDVPARVCILDMPSRNELRVKNLFNVADCKMHWQVSML